METITYSEVQELVLRLPETKLQLAYRLLTDLAEDEEVLSPQHDFLELSLVEQRRILAEQAQKMAAHYEQTTIEREAWQAGDFEDEH